MSKKIRIIADDKIPFLKGVLEEVAEMKYLPGKQISRLDLQNADGLIIRTRTKCDQSLLEGTPVKYIATATIGHDHIDAKWCADHGIEWTNAPGCNAGSVEQYIASVLLNLTAREHWDLSKKCIGIVGVGQVGSRVERICRAMGMRVLLNDPPRERSEGGGKFVPFDTLLQEADIISLHVPLNRKGQDATYHMVNQAFIDRMRKGTWLFNSSRGEVVDSVALKEGMVSSKLGGVVLDVFEGEPVLDPKLHALCNIATPHIAGYSTDGKANGTAMSVQALSRFYGLGLDDWYPENLPEPDSAQLTSEGSAKARQEILTEMILSTYDVMTDDVALRDHPDQFEQLRGNYPLRREPGAYEVSLRNDKEGVAGVLKEFGFKVSSQQSEVKSQS